MKLSYTKYSVKKAVLESVIQRQILDYLNLKDIFHFRVNTMGVMRNGRYCPSPTIRKGTADIIAILEGRFVAIEVKRFGAKQTADQAKFQTDVETSGGIYILAYSVNDVRATLGL